MYRNTHTHNARSLSHSPSDPPPSFTQSPYPPRSLVRDGQTSPHRPRLVVSRSTCPPLFDTLILSSPPHGVCFITACLRRSSLPSQGTSPPSRECAGTLGSRGSAVDQRAAPVFPVRPCEVRAQRWRANLSGPCRVASHYGGKTAAFALTDLWVTL